MVFATTSDPLALDLWPPSGASEARPLPGDPDAAAGVAARLPKLEVEEYVRGLEEERSKMEGFRRELPLCMLILTHVIEGLKGELSQRGGAEKQQPEDEGEMKKQRKDCPASEKVKWMSSARLWSHSYVANTSTNNADIRGDGKNDAGEVGVTDEPPSRQAPRKARRSWSAELHRRFVRAIEQLGGTQAATPKQIRGLMKVDGLTNDEVKSHLQKYRLHRQRLPVSSSPVDQPAVLWGGLRVTKEIYPAGKQRTSQSGFPPGPPSARQEGVAVSRGEACHRITKESE